MVKFSSVPLVVALLTLTTTASAQVVSYEALFYPETEGWQRSTFCTPERSLDDGWLIQSVGPLACKAPPDGDIDSYTRPITAFDGVYGFYVEWRMQVDGDSSEFPWGAPAVVTAWNQGGEAYWFAIANDEVKFIRDSFAEILCVDITPDVHVHRLEIFGADLYVWYIDGVVVHQGIPGGPFPSFTPSIGWRARSAFLSSVVYLDYLRYGVIPEAGSGDANSDGLVNPDDLYFMQECISTPAGSWPGCSWADMDSEGDTDCADWQAFLAAWTDPSEPPSVPQCDCQTDLTADGATNATDLAQLLGAWGPNAGHPADFNDDTFVNASDLAQLLGNWGMCP